MKLVGIYRQIALTMMAMAVGITLLVVITSYVLYTLWQTYWPNYFPDEDYMQTGPEWAWLILTTLTALALAISVASHISKRILAPLKSVTDSIKKVAEGDLSARAFADKNAPLEAFHLVNDFNVLVAKLQQVTDEQAFWNAAIAHELRTPVTILRGRLQGLAEGIFQPDERQFRSLLVQVESLSQLIEDLRVVSLDESGHLAINSQKTDITAEVQFLIESMAGAFEKSNQHITLDIQASSAFCDSLKIRQAMLALLENATKHAKPGHIIIKTRIENGDFILTIEDEGPGIPDTFLPFLFTAFRRAPTAHGHGSGLGLAVVAAIARAHGGKATYSRNTLDGSSFTIVIPQPT